MDAETIRLVAELGDADTRAAAARALVGKLGANALTVFVEDAEVDALVPAPGLAQTLPGGPTWRRFLAECRSPGIHRGEVAYPTIGQLVPAVACSTGAAVFVLLGGTVDERQLEPMRHVLSLVSSTLCCQQEILTLSGALAVAREDARSAGALARSLDAARTQLQRQAETLALAQRRAEEAMRAKDEFLAMLGHELRNPLAPIMTALEIMRLNGDDSRERAVLQRQAEQLMRLVDDLLDVSRIASGKVELRTELVELAAVMARAVEVASPMLEQKRQLLSLEMPASGLLVDADPARLAQVFSNLLTNAAKYSDPGTRITVSAETEAGRVVVRVEDEGWGIEPHLLEAVFDRFIQGRQRLDRSQGGLGLGLAIVKNLVMLHGGTVRAISEGRGSGSVFEVTLPLCDAQAGRGEPGPHHPATEVPASPALVRVLMVDDNQDAAEMVSVALAGLGYEVRTAHDGPSALEIAAEFEPAIAVLDIGLPVMDGYEVGRRLRASDGGRGIRLVALTGYGQRSDRQRSREAGFDDHLVKPVDLDTLLRVLEDLSRAAG